MLTLHHLINQAFQWCCLYFSVDGFPNYLALLNTMWNGSSHVSRSLWWTAWRKQDICTYNPLNQTLWVRNTMCFLQINLKIGLLLISTLNYVQKYHTCESDVKWKRWLIFYLKSDCVAQDVDWTTLLLVWLLIFWRSFQLGPILNLRILRMVDWRGSNIKVYQYNRLLCNICLVK